MLHTASVHEKLRVEWIKQVPDSGTANCARATLRIGLENLFEKTGAAHLVVVAVGRVVVVVYAFSLISAGKPSLWLLVWPVKLFSMISCCATHLRLVL